MRENEWPEDRVKMHVDFWTALETHPWRRSPLAHLKRALLLYQSRERQRWHRVIGTAHSWSLAKLNQTLLDRTKEEILETERVEQLKNLRQISERYSAMAAQRSTSGSKRPLSPPLQSYQPADSADYKRQRSFRTPPSTDYANPNTPLPACAVCLGRHRHLVIDCRATKLWDQKRDAFAERIHKALFAKDGRRICAKWQREEGCSERHDSKHFCSGCGAPSHGAQRCPHAQKIQPNNTV